MNMVLVDLHGVDQSSIGYIVSLPALIIELDVIVLIESSKDNILQRRSKDSKESKERILNTVKSLKEHVGILRVTMVSCSAIWGVT